MSEPDLFGDAPAASLFDSPAPRWRNIAAHRPFLDDLAAALYANLSAAGPEALADAVVLTPTRRGARALAEAFVGAAGGRALLLPQIRALGDLEEGEPPFEPGDLALDLPPAVSPLRRRFELGRLVAEHEPLLGRTLDAAQALDLADALAGFLDAVQIEERDDPDAVDRLVEGELAKHWEVSARFLSIAGRAWPKRLEELGLVDVAVRRTALLRALAERWTQAPPASALIAAGSVGTAPAEADLLAVIARADRGVVVLPGLDTELADDAWAQVGEAHPQGAMRRLLIRAGVERADVLPWPAQKGAQEHARGRARRRVVNEALRPPEATADWLALIGPPWPRRRGAGAGGADGALRQKRGGRRRPGRRPAARGAGDAGRDLRPRHPRPSAGPARVGAAGAVGDRGGQLGRRAPDQLSHRRPDDADGRRHRRSARPADAARAGQAPPRPAGAEGSAARAGAARPRAAGPARPRVPPGWADLFAKVETHGDALPLARALQAAIDHAAAPFASGLASAQTAVRALAEALEMAATDADGRLGDLWAGAGGEAAAALAAAVIDEGASLPPVTAPGFLQLVEGLVSREVVRTGGAPHPRLRILGLIEARLVRADRVVLAGLEEGTWPRAAAIDPFLSRPMRAALGLPPPERRTGLSAHDFAQAACAPNVAMIHAERRDGQPAVKSRWLWRLETLAKGADRLRTATGAPGPPVTLPARPEVSRWARALDAPLTPAPPALRGAERPHPTPPVEARPTTLSVTRIEAWMRDPYATYARYVLDLKPLPPPDAAIEAMARGTAIHAAFQAYAERHDAIEGDRVRAFADLLVNALVEAGTPAARMTRERALADRVAGWAVDLERRRREGAEIQVEREGRLTFPTARGDFTVTAKADRLEVRRDQVDVIDFKSGAPPTDKQVASGLSPQLTLTAAILEGGGFADLGPRRAGVLSYVRVTGRGAGGEETEVAAPPESSQLAAAALEGLKAQVARYDDPSTPYLSWAMPHFMGRYGGDYDHLARVWEWRVMGTEEGEA